MNGPQEMPEMEISEVAFYLKAGELFSRFSKQTEEEGMLLFNELIGLEEEAPYTESIRLQKYRNWKKKDFVALNDYLASLHPEFAEFLEFSRSGQFLENNHTVQNNDEQIQHSQTSERARSATRSKLVAVLGAVGIAFLGYSGLVSQHSKPSNPPQASKSEAVDDQKLKREDFQDQKMDPEMKLLQKKYAALKNEERDAIRNYLFSRGDKKLSKDWENEVNRIRNKMNDVQENILSRQELFDK